MWHAVQYPWHNGRKMTAEYVRNQDKEKRQAREEQHDARRINAPHFFEYCFALHGNTIY